ncbi:MAG TPA: tetratricopeptide repeat protein [Puia sp.]|nr:tetratricopeptide repeat protein [Puia sp.]
MKKRIYIFTLIFFGIAISIVLVRFYLSAHESYAMLDRKGPQANMREWKLTREYALQLDERLQKNPNDVKASLALSTLFLQEARVTGNYIYYDRAALHYVNLVLKSDPSNFEALTFQALIYLSQHHFSEGLAIAEKARNLNPYNAFIYGILVDAQVEMGNYDSAVEDADQMVSIRPDLRSYSRVSYLREIYGDYPGAIEAMQMAVDAGVPGAESTEWARIQLGHLYEYTGDFRRAEMHYTIALNERPDYPYAVAGLGRIALASKDIPKAIQFFHQADSLINDYSFKEELVDIYHLSGQHDKAEKLSEQVIESMNRDAGQAQNNQNIGHYADKELAIAYLKTGNFDKALDHALLEYNRRPDNIDVNETLAWVYYSKGDVEKAIQYIKTALRTRSKNPVLLSHAGLIFAKAGQKDLAKSTLQESLKLNPNIDGALKIATVRALENL